MLLELKVANHRCLADEQVLRLHAASHKLLLDENTIEVPGKTDLRAIKAAIIYGPNGGGKSSLINAMALMQQLVLYSAAVPDQPLPMNPFRLDPGYRNSPSHFEVTFVDKEVRYRYGFSVTAARIEGEWLSAWPEGREQMWFERDGSKNEWSFGREFGGEQSLIQKATRPNALFLSTAANLNHPKATLVRSWFAERLKVLAPLQISPLFYYWAFAGMHPLQYTLSQAETRPDLKAAVTDFLRMADVGVRDFRIETVPPTEAMLAGIPEAQRAQYAQQATTKRIFTEHEGVDGQPIHFTIEEESLGTQNLFHLAGPWVDIVRNGDTVFVDELLASLHPLLVRRLVTLIHEAKSGAQLVMTTHDTNLLDPTLVRRDEVYFVEKDRTGKAHLYPLLDYQPRKDEALEKGYLAGRYGAIPFIGPFQFTE